MTVVTGVAGSGKSTLISRVFAQKYEKDVIKIDQSPVTATNRSMPATFLGFFDEIRKVFAKENNVEEGLFSFNSKELVLFVMVKEYLLQSLYSWTLLLIHVKLAKVLDIVKKFCQNYIKVNV